MEYVFGGSIHRLQVAQPPNMFMRLLVSVKAFAYRIKKQDHSDPDSINNDQAKSIASKTSIEAYPCWQNKFLPFISGHLREPHGCQMNEINMNDVVKEWNPPEGTEEIHHSTLPSLRIGQKQEDAPKGHQ